MRNVNIIGALQLIICCSCPACTESSLQIWYQRVHFKRCKCKVHSLSTGLQLQNGLSRPDAPDLASDRMKFISVPQSAEAEDSEDAPPMLPTSAVANASAVLYCWFRHCSTLDTEAAAAAKLLPAPSLSANASASAGHSRCKP